MLCDRGHFGLGFCVVHYHSYVTPRKGYKGGKGWPKGVRRINQEICKVENCDKKVYANNLCHSHFANYKRCGNPLGLNINKCLATGCNIKSPNLFCAMHSKQYTNPRTGNKGENNPRWNGGKSYFDNHYLVKKHRKILIQERGCMCQECGIELDPKGIHQHHIDGNKNNHKDSNIRLLCLKCHAFHKKGKTPRSH